MTPRWGGGGVDNTSGRSEVHDLASDPGNAANKTNITLKGRKSVNNKQPVNAESSDDDDFTLVRHRPDETSVHDLKLEATSIYHQMTHLPKNPWCDHCMRAKMQRKPHRRGATKGFGKPPEKFGDHVTMDYILSYTKGSKGMNGESDVAVFKDLYTGWTQGIPVKSRSAAHLLGAIKEFAGRVNDVKVLYTDKGPEIDAALMSTTITPVHSTIGIKQNNGIAERANRTIEDGSRTILVMSGLPTYFWPYAVKHFSFSYNISCRLKDGDSSWNLRHKKGQFKSKLIPFGALVDYQQIPELLRQQSKFSPRSIPGVFMSYHVRPGGEWKDEFVLMKLEDFKSIDLGINAKPVRIGEAVSRELELSKNHVFSFPMKAKYEAVNRSIIYEGDDGPVDPAEYDCPPIEPASAQSAVDGEDLDELEEVIPDQEASDQSVRPKTPKSTRLPAVPRASEQTRQSNIPDHVTASGDQWIDGILYRPRKNTTRPPDVTPEMWRLFTPKAREIAKDNFQKFGRSYPNEGNGARNESSAVAAPPPYRADSMEMRFDSVFDFYSAVDNGRLSAPAVYFAKRFGYPLPMDSAASDDNGSRSSRSFGGNMGNFEDGTTSRTVKDASRTEVASRTVKDRSECSGNVQSHNFEDGSRSSRNVGSTSSASAPSRPSTYAGKTFPRMPTFEPSQGPREHRTRHPHRQLFLEACVARPVTKSERLTNPKAQQAVQKEWDRLRAIKCWDESTVYEWSELAKWCRINGQKYHVGRIFDIIVEKGSELPEGDPGRKFKGRVVFQGNNVWDENYDVALFQDLSSSPATMEAGKFVDFYGMLPGHDAGQSDAEQAYTQTTLKGVPTVVRLPPEQWPDSWKGMRDPVCPLILALYGHPDSGGFWEQHCEEHVLSLGFKLIPSWYSCYWHDVWKVFLVIYVDDFKMSGPKSILSHAWAELKKGIRMDEPTSLGKYLGCDHVVSVKWHKDLSAYVTVLEYDMSSFLRSCVDRYLELAQCPVESLRKVATPFGVESREQSPMRDPCLCKECSDQNPSAPSGDPVPDPSWDEIVGELQPIASRVLMKILYAARMARYDLLKCVNSLASCITKWTKRCDFRLHRLICYIHSSIDLRLTGWIANDPMHQITFDLFVDADHSGCQKTMRSTSGIYLTVSGPHVSWPIAGVSKKQTATSHSTPEAEMVAYDFGLRMDGLPALLMFRTLLGRYNIPVALKVREDNSALIQVCQSGKNPTMRYLSLTHGTNVAWLHEVSTSRHVELVKTDTLSQAADIFTKPFECSTKWAPLLSLINVFDSKAKWGGEKVWLLLLRWFTNPGSRSMLLLLGRLIIIRWQCCSYPLGLCVLDPFSLSVNWTLSNRFLK